MNHNPDLVESNEQAWNRAALNYTSEVEDDIAALRAGETSFSLQELQLLGDFSSVARAIHLQCSHGLDALSLLQLGAKEVIGVDISQAMLEQAEQKARTLGANAKWIHSDVLSVPDWLDGTADLVYTGKGALPWMGDIDQWARVVRRLLKPGGRLFLHEGHPLNWIWETELSVHRLREDRRGYFDKQPRRNEDFPAAAVARFTPENEDVPDAWEWQWTLGDVVTAVAKAGLYVEYLAEHSDHFWNQFPEISDEEMVRLPHTYTLIAKRYAVHDTT